MSTRTTWVYVAISILLVVGYVFTGTLDGKAAVQVFNAKKIFDFEKSSVVRLSIDTAQADRFEATRNKSTEWVMSAPYGHVPANYLVWEELAKVVTLLTNEMVIEESPDDLSIYGLETPPLKLEIETDSHALIQMNIGNLDPTQNNRYAQRIGEDSVFLVPARMSGYLYRSLKDVRDTRVFPNLPYESIDTVQFTRFPADDPGNAVENSAGLEETYALNTDGVWEITQPIQVQAYRNKVEHLITQALQLQGDGYIDSPEELGDYGLSHEASWAQLTLSDSVSGHSQTLQFGWTDDMADDGRMFVKKMGNPSVFTIDAGFQSFLPEAPSEFREPHLFSRDVIDIVGIHYKDSKQEFHLSLDDDLGWTLTDPAYDDTDQATVNTYIAWLAKFKGLEFVDSEELIALDNETITMTFDFADGSPSTTIAVGGLVPDASPPLFYARQDSGSIVKVPFHVRDYMRSTPYTFRNKKLFTFEEGAVTEVKMHLEGTYYHFQRELGVWSVLEPKGYHAESQSELDALLKVFNQYAALNVADPVPADDITGVDSPDFELRVTYVTPEGIVTQGPLKVGNLISSSARARFSWVEGREETFYVGNGFIEDIRRGVKGIRPAPSAQ